MLPACPFSFFRVASLISLLLPALPVLAEMPASTPLPAAAALPASLQLQGAQVQALGIRSEAILPASGSHADNTGALRRFPAKVVVPNSQLRFVSAPLPGLVETLHVAPGMPVRAGQVLAQMLSPQVLELHREAIQADSQAGLATRQLQRDELLFSAGVIAEARLQATQAAAVQAQALARERHKALALAGAAQKTGKSQAGQAAHLSLRAPIDGVVLEQMASVGQRLESAAPLYKLGKLSPLQLEIQVPQSLTAALQPGMRIQVPEAGGQGKLTVIGQAVEPGSQSVLLRASIQNENGRLKPGQMVEVALLPAPASGRQNAVTAVPARALVRHQERFWVFAEQAADRQQARYQVLPVQVVARQGEQVQVSGLPEPVRLVVQGVSGLKAIWTGVGRE